MKTIIITNGYPRCGKDTFAEILNDYIPTTKYSSIDCVRNGALLAGWYDNRKTEADRRFLSDLKKLLINYNDYPFNDVKILAEDFCNQQYSVESQVLIIDIREPEEIQKIVNHFKGITDVITVFISNNNIKPIVSNQSDANVEDYIYDYYIDNNGTLEEFKETVRTFAIEVLAITN